MSLPYDGGRAFAVVQDPTFPEIDTSSLLTAPTTYMMFLESQAVSDHRKAWRHYLRFYSLDVAETGNTIRGDGSGGSMIATFDDEARISGIEAEFNE